MKEKIIKWYNTYLPSGRRVWTKEMVHDAVGKVITDIEYEEITGEAYV